MGPIGEYGVPVLVAVSLSAACGSDDDVSCEPGGVQGCPVVHDGPREYRYCQADETWSDCTPEVLCDPLAQTGCPEGLVCYLASISTTVCAAAETLACTPVETWGRGIEGSGCQPLCVSEGSGTLNEDPEHCEDGEVCMNVGLSNDGVGECYTPPEDGE
jgi:hypothetical protein